MVASDSSVFPGIRSAGLALIAGITLGFLSSTFYPGGAIIDPVDQTDFSAVIDVWTDNASLTHILTLTFIVAMLLEMYGFLGLFRLLGRQSGFANGALLFGLVTSLFSWGIFVIGMGMRHIVVHIMQHGLGAGAEAQADLEVLALTVYTAMAGVHFAFLSVSPIATMFTGLGLVSRFEEFNFYKLASYGLILAGLVGIVNFTIAQHLNNVDLAQFAWISAIILLISSVCLGLIGVGMARGRYEFTGEDRYAW